MRGRAPRDRCPTVGSDGGATPAGAARKDADQRCSVVPVRRGSVRAFCNDPAEACQFCVPSPQQVPMGCPSGAPISRCPGSPRGQARFTRGRAVGASLHTPERGFDVRRKQVEVKGLGVIRIHG